MEAIAGIVYPDVFQMNDLIYPMLNTMKHRGKEPCDIHTYKNIQIGICGNKLGVNDKSTVFVGLDGTIDNQEEIYKKLLEHGHQFGNYTTSEIILYAYNCWDSAFVEHLSGDFAIVILDLLKQKIVLARDRVGKKPLYWFHDQHHFIFASELKGLLATGAIPQTPALDSLASYLYFGYIPQDMTPIAKINKLLPAHYLQFHWDGSKTIIPYWHYSSYFEKSNILSKSDIVQNLDFLLRESVRMNLPNEKNFGCALSGGMGSASVAYYVTKEERFSVPAFTVGFRGENDQDVRAAQKAGSILGLNQETHFIERSNFLDDYVSIAWHLDEPLADPNIIATWNLAEKASEKVKMIFSGMGSDELFAGHSRYSIEEQDSSYFKEIIHMSAGWLQQLLIPLFNFIYKPAAYQLIKKARTNPWQFEYLSHNAVFDEKMLAEASPKLANIFDPEVFLHKFHNLNRIKSTVASFLYFDVKTRLPDCYILQYERLTAAHGLEWKAPFLNKSLVEFAASLYEPQVLQEKETAFYLKAIFKEIFPPSFINRPKKTRREFLRRWLESPSMRDIFQMLQNGALVEAGLISELWLQNHIEDLGSNPHAFRYLWAVFSLEIWFRIFINNPIQTTFSDISVKQLLVERP
ncbi:MAG TPA: asparagine synthase (glutamine-hydrolyzing) [Waddliaceae bacterium]